MPKVITLSMLALLFLPGCNSQQKQAEKHDVELRQQVEQLKKKSKAYPVNGSKTWTHYLP